MFVFLLGSETGAELWQEEKAQQVKGRLLAVLYYSDMEV